MLKPIGCYSTSLQLLIPTREKINGVIVKTFTEDLIFYANVKSFGGTELTVNDKIVIEDTLNVECWFNPIITSGCNVKLLSDDSEWEIIGTPENIELRNQLMKFKLRRIKGGA